MKNSKFYTGKWLKPTVIMFLSTGIILLIFFVSYRPRVFYFYYKVTPVNSHLTGSVFKSTDGLIWVQLDSGSRLTVQMSPLKAYLSRYLNKSGIRIGRYLLLPQSLLYGAD